MILVSDIVVKPLSKFNSYHDSSELVFVLIKKNDSKDLDNYNESIKNIVKRIRISCFFRGENKVIILNFL